MTAKKTTTPKTPRKKAAPKKKETKAETEEPKVQAQEAPKTPATAPDQEPSGKKEHKKDHPITVVIPYRDDKAKGDELRYALRGWAKHLVGCRVVIVGDAPAWLAKEVVHIAADDPSDNAQENTTAKLMAAIASDEVPETFILSCDDIYPATFLTISDIDIPKANGPLENKSTLGGHYRKTVADTLAVLRKKGFAQPWDYDTHTPYMFSKDILAEVLETYGSGDMTLLIPTLYFNHLYPDLVPILIDGGVGRKACTQFVGRVYRKNPNMEVLREAAANRKFINHNNDGYEGCMEVLKEKYPDKCRFEK